jgi:NAD(P)-dependent dehydrogenase (short-subunit alcohol dehydrogenase family)
MSAYTAAKCAVEGFVKVAADELAGAGIRVNAVRPGLTPSGGTSGMFADRETMDLFAAETPLVPWRGGFGQADDIGRAIRWLAGPESAWITGQSIAVDGGHELRRYPDMTYMMTRLHGNEAAAALRRGEPPPRET